MSGVGRQVRSNVVGYRAGAGRGLLAGIVTLTLLAAWPTIASAGYWRADAVGTGGAIEYTGEPGEANQVTVEFDGSAVTVTDTAGVQSDDEYYCEQNPDPPDDPFARCPGGKPALSEFDEPDPCTRLSATSFRCPYAEYLGDYRLEDGNDAFAYVGAAPPLQDGGGFDETFQLSVNGGFGDDSLAGSPYDDELDGDRQTSESENSFGYSSGSDRVHGGGGDDLVGAGRFDTAGHRNLLTGGPGDDELETSGGTNRAHTGPGNDRFVGGEGSDVVDGAEGNDDLFGGFGPDLLHGSDGNDSVEGGPDRDVAHGDSGRDDLTALAGNCGGPDKFVGGTGRDTLYAVCGEPTILFRDGARDRGTCRRKVNPARLRLDSKDDLTGPCKG